MFVMSIHNLIYAVLLVARNVIWLQPTALNICTFAILFFVRLTKQSLRVQLYLWGRSVGSFPKQRLVIKPSFHGWAKIFLKWNFFYKRNFPLDGQTRWMKSSSVSQFAWCLVVMKPLKPGLPNLESSALSLGHCNSNTVLCKVEHRFNEPLYACTE